MTTNLSSGAIRWLVYMTSAALIAVIVRHIIQINMSLSFMTLDELNFIVSNTLSTTYDTVTTHGRVSHLISWPIAKLLSFYNPTILELTPRLISILSLYLILTIYLESVYRSWAYAIAFASIAIGGHLIDWQHNGMVAFFGSYNIFLSAFLLSLILVKDARSMGTVKLVAVILLLLISFSSELFVGLAVLCTVYFAIFAKNGRKIIFLFSGAVLAYIVLFIVFNFLVDSQGQFIVTKESMGDYLYGNLDGEFSLVEIVEGTLIYVYNSIPISSFRISSNFKYLYLVLGLVLALLIISGRKNAKPHKERYGELFLIGSVLFIVPNFLISMQPMKLSWVLTGASNRYVFSYYSWIGFVFLLSIFLYLVSKKRVYPIILFSALIGPFVVNSMKDSIGFTGPYIVSTNKWRDLNELLIDSKDDGITIGTHYLDHPGITPISLGYLQQFSTKFYNKELYLNSNLQVGFNFGSYLPEFITELHGISGYEPGGRWTDGSEAIIRYKDNIPDNVVVKIGISTAYTENNMSNIIVIIGDWSGSFDVLPGKIVELVVNKSTIANEIKFVIPYPVSPSELGNSDDPRKLGIRLTHLSFEAVK